MTNAAVADSFRRRDNDLRIIRGAFVETALRSKRWTIRAASLTLGISNTALGDRVKGRVSFLADELEKIANLVDEDPVDFYRQYLAAETKKGPASEEAGPTLPDLDSNQEPAG